MIVIRKHSAPLENQFSLELTSLAALLAMATSVRTNLNFLALHLSTTQRTITRNCIPIRCGPRGNRGPLLKGRVLSTEAIQAVQALKRAQRADAASLNDALLSKTLSRLIKSDLIAAFKELLRQDHSEIAVKVFLAVRSEYKPELSLYADLVSALGRKGATKAIDELVNELEKEGRIQCDDKGLAKLLKALIAADRVESTVRIYRLMKKSGWGSTYEVDEHVAKVLSKGVRRLGNLGQADEIDLELRSFHEGVLGKANV